jgi:hypothetical protein
MPTRAIHPFVSPTPPSRVDNTVYTTTVTTSAVSKAATLPETSTQARTAVEAITAIRITDRHAELPINLCAFVGQTFRDYSFVCFPSKSSADAKTGGSTLNDENNIFMQEEDDLKSKRMI